MIYLSLRIYAATDGNGAVDEPNGPLFHKWLPDGEGDAIHFKSVAPPNALRVWFTRRGYVDHGMITYDFGRQEVDASIMRRQGWLDAGPLRGEAVFTHVTQPELAAVSADKKGDEDYVSLAKRVIDFLLPPMQSLYDTLRLQYGQYWVPELRPWDSRNMSLGGYCQSTFGLKWRTDADSEWKKFLPDEPSHTIRVMPIPGRGYGEFLTEGDWRDIQSSLDAKPAHPLALRVAGRAHELSNSGYVAEAYIQAVTALELAIEHFIHQRGQRYSKAVSNHVKTFTKQSLTSQLSVLALASGAISAETLDRATRAIDTRNKIVHEARQLAHLPLEDLLALMRCIQVLLGVEEYKSPRLINGNGLDAPLPGAA